MKHPRNQEGAVLFVVLMIVMVGTASALFSATTVSHEVRGTGFARQQLQTRYAARSALIGALEWFDIFGPQAVRDIVQTRGDTDAKLFVCVGTPKSCYPEPPLAGNRRAYRLYEEHFGALIEPDGSGNFKNPPVDADAVFGGGSAYTPAFVVDLYDEHIVNKLPPGAAAQGGTKFKYMRTTMTARGRAQVGDGTVDFAEPEAGDGGRQWNETGADMRGYIISGPFISSGS
jgi:hypothetical protein